MSSSAFPIDSSSTPVAPPAPSGVARLGRCDAEIVAASGDDICLRHSSALKIGMEVALSWFVGATRLQTPVVVRSCRVLALGGGTNGSTLYETHVTLRNGNDFSSHGEPRS